MAIIHKTLRLSKQVAGGSSEKQSYIPPDGAKVRLKWFMGDAAFIQNAHVRIEWDGDPLWTIKGNSTHNTGIKLLGADGIKKVEIIMRNNLAGALYLSAEAQLRIKT